MFVRLLVPVLGHPAGAVVRVVSISDLGAVTVRIGGYFPVVSFDDVEPA